MLCAIACLCVYPLESQSDLPSLFPFSPNSVLLEVLNSFLRCVRPLCRCWCPPFSAGHTTILFICLPGLSLVVSAHFRWPCSISIHLSPRSVTAGVRPFSAGHVHFYSFVSQVCHCWCPPFFRWRCDISGQLFPRSVTPGVRPFPLAMQHFYSFVLQVCQWCSISIDLFPVCQCWSSPFSAGRVALLFICLPGLSLLVSALFRWPCSISILVSQVCYWWCPPLSAGHTAFYSFVYQVCPLFSVGHVAFLCICLPGLSLLLFPFFRWPCSISIHLSLRSVTAGVPPFLLAM